MGRMGSFSIHMIYCKVKYCISTEVVIITGDFDMLRGGLHTTGKRWGMSDIICNWRICDGTIKFLHRLDVLTWKQLYYSLFLKPLADTARPTAICRGRNIVEQSTSMNGNVIP